MNSMITSTTSARIRNFLKALRVDRRGAELVEVLIVLAIVALGGIAAMNGIKDSTSKKAEAVKGAIDGITVGN